MLRRTRTRARAPEVPRSRRSWLLPLVVFLAWTTAVPTAVRAETGRIGLGVIAGEPTGLSYKNWVGSRHALDAAAAWSFVDEGALHLHADYLWHFFDRIDDVEGGRIPLYVGLGGRVKFGDEDELLGIRVPVGLDFLLDDAPLDVFLEVVPILDVAPESEVRLNAAIGARFWFDAD